MKMRYVPLLLIVTYLTPVCADSITEKDLTLLSDDAADELGVINYNVTIYKDVQHHDKQAWRDVVRSTRDSARAIKNNDQKVAWNEVKKTVKQIRNTNGDTSGIHGEISVALSNGKCGKGCCGDRCACVKKYKGNCPCSVRGTACSREVSPVIKTCECAKK